MSFQHQNENYFEFTIISTNLQRNLIYTNKNRGFFFSSINSNQVKDEKQGWSYYTLEATPNHLPTEMYAQQAFVVKNFLLHQLIVYYSS